MTANSNNEDNKSSIHEARLQSNAAIAAHDSKGLLDFWMDDFVVTTGSGKIIAGKENVMAEFEKLFQQLPALIYTRRPHAILISDTNTLAFETGTGEGNGVPGAHPRVGGSYSAMWQKENEEWKLRSELFVTLHHYQV